MLDDDDLDAAVGEGLVTQAQADALRTFSVQRRKFGAAERADEERFRFMRGFNDFFFAVGVVLLGAGLSMFAGMYASPIAYAAAAVIMWGLAELLVRRMRLVLPGMVIAIYFVVFVVFGIAARETGCRNAVSMSRLPGGQRKFHGRAVLWREPAACASKLRLSPWPVRDFMPASAFPLPC